MKDKKRRTAATEELADVVICALAFANRTGVNIASAVRKKVEKMPGRILADKFKGRF
jgi:NTP pyrophosphatase (non-canonical NTP hydrolase)